MAEQNGPVGGKKFSATIPIPSKLNLDDETCLEQSWKRFKRITVREALLERLVRQAKL